jgi:hypothetical protein
LTHSARNAAALHNIDEGHRKGDHCSVGRAISKCWCPVHPRRIKYDLIRWLFE